MAEPSTSWQGNLIFFAGVFVAFQIAYVLLTYAVDVMTGYDSPAMLGLIVFYVAAEWAGRRYATRVSWKWDQADRSELALRYSITAMVISFFMAAAAYPFSPELKAMPMSGWLIVAFITPLYAWAQYGIARWAFARVDERGPFPGASK